MLQLTPQSRIFVVIEPVDFRKGIDGLAAVCRQVLGDNRLLPTSVRETRFSLAYSHPHNMNLMPGRQA